MNNIFRLQEPTDAFDGNPIWFTTKIKGYIQREADAWTDGIESSPMYDTIRQAIRLTSMAGDAQDAVRDAYADYAEAYEGVERQHNATANELKSILRDYPLILKADYASRLNEHNERHDKVLKGLSALREMNKRNAQVGLDEATFKAKSRSQVAAYRKSTEGLKDALALQDRAKVLASKLELICEYLDTKKSAWQDALTHFVEQLYIAGIERNKVITWHAPADDTSRDNGRMKHHFDGIEPASTLRQKYNTVELPSLYGSDRTPIHNAFNVSCLRLKDAKIEQVHLNSILSRLNAGDAIQGYSIDSVQARIEDALSTQKSIRNEYLSCIDTLLNLGQKSVVYEGVLSTLE